MKTKQIAVILSCAILTVSGMYLFTITTWIPGWSDISMGNQLFMASPAAMMWASVVGIMKTI